MEFIDMSCCGSDYLSGVIQEKMDVEGGLLI